MVPARWIVVLPPRRGSKAFGPQETRIPTSAFDTAGESRKKPGSELAVCASGSSMSGPVGGTERLTGEQRPVLASSDVAASEKALQNQLENLIGLSTVYRRTPETIITTAARA